MSLDEAEITRLVTHVTEDPHEQPYHFTPGGPFILDTDPDPDHCGVTAKTGCCFSRGAHHRRQSPR